jgi:hypothetical protein
MADADDKLDFCKQALGELGTRSTITSVDPPDASPEAYYCNLFFNSTRDQALRAAHWNFAGRTHPSLLWKALPGTPENPTTSAGYTWSVRDPPPPWLYAYGYPGEVVQIRRVRGQSQTVNSGIPLFSGVGPIMGTNYNQLDCAPFEVASERYDRVGTLLEIAFTIADITIVADGENYRAGDYISLTQDGAQFGTPAIVAVYAISEPSGGVFRARSVYGGTFLNWSDTAILTQLSTTGNGTGFTCNATDFIAHPTIMKVILTNASNVVLDVTSSNIEINEYDASFADAFSLALQGKLALALLGDKAMAQAKLQQANLMLLEARVRDGNEGLTIMDHVPDWLQVRGVSAMNSGQEWFNPPYGPLFAV